MLATRQGETPFTRLIPRAFSHFRALFTLLLVLLQIYASKTTGTNTIYRPNRESGWGGGGSGIHYSLKI